MKQRLSSVLLVFGLLVSSISQVVSHFISLPDFIAGAFMGLGIGLMLFAIILQQRNAAS